MAVETLERRPTRLYWWKEAGLVIAFYLVYSFTRNRFGSHRVEIGEEPLHAFNNAIRIIDWEKALHLFHEPQIQSHFLDYTVFLQFWNTFYGTAHFVVTAAAFIWLYRARPAIFPLWRNVLGATTALAIVGFSLFPLMPPRLLDSTELYGGARLEAEQHAGPFGFVDTLEEYGGPWSFDSGAVQQVSNQYAGHAQPPHRVVDVVRARHVAADPQAVGAGAHRALPGDDLVRDRRTANHYFLDAAGGLLTLGVGYLIGRGLFEWNERRLGRADGAPADRAPTS